MELLTHLPDFIEENRALMRQLKPPFPVLEGSREGAALMAEQLALQQFLRDGSAIDGNKRFVPPIAVEMDGVGDELLARPAFPQDEHCGVTLGDPLDGPVELLHGRALAHDLVVSLALLDLRAQESVFLLEGVELLCPLENDQDFIQLGRLGEIIEGPSLDRLNGRFDGSVAGEHHDQGVGLVFGEMVQYLHAAHAGHHEIRDDHIVARVLGFGDGFGAAGRHVDRVPLLPESVHNDFEGQGFIVHHEDSWRRSHRRFSAEVIYQTDSMMALDSRDCQKSITPFLGDSRKEWGK